jgi:hypothetical protein
MVQGQWWKGAFAEHAKELSQRSQELGKRGKGRQQKGQETEKGGQEKRGKVKRGKEGKGGGLGGHSEQEEDSGAPVAVWESMWRWLHGSEGDRAAAHTAAPAAAEGPAAATQNVTQNVDPSMLVSDHSHTQQILQARVGALGQVFVMAAKGGAGEAARMTAAYELGAITRDPRNSHSTVHMASELLFRLFSPPTTPLERKLRKAPGKWAPSAVVDRDPYIN